MSERTCGCKVGRVAERYDLSDLDAELRRRHEAGASLRDLERFVNERILRSAINDVGGDVSTLISSDRSLEALYEVLRGESDPEERARVRTRLEQAGVDVADVTDDWVSHATIKSHFNECLGLETGTETTVTEEDALDTVEWARSRTEGIVEETIKRLQNAGRLDVTAPTTSVSVRITCEECGRSYTPRSLIDDGSCACEVREGDAD